MADHLQELWVDPTILTTDPQVRALAGTFAAECRELAKRWAEEKEGGL